MVERKIINGRHTTTQMDLVIDTFIKHSSSKRGIWCQVLQSKRHLHGPNHSSTLAYLALWISSLISYCHQATEAFSGNFCDEKCRFRGHDYSSTLAHLVCWISSLILPLEILWKVLHSCAETNACLTSLIVPSCRHT